VALVTLPSLPVPGQVFAPWASPDLTPCSPLCERVFPSGLIAVHRERCDRFERYCLGVLLGQWPRHRPWA
jgi:hypothetical protein